MEALEYQHVFTWPAKMGTHINIIWQAYVYKYKALFHGIKIYTMSVFHGLRSSKMILVRFFLCPFGHLLPWGGCDAPKHHLQFGHGDDWGRAAQQPGCRGRRWAAELKPCLGSCRYTWEPRSDGDTSPHPEETKELVIGISHSTCPQSTKWQPPPSMIMLSTKYQICYVFT